MKTSSRVLGVIATLIVVAECLFWLGVDDRAAGLLALAAASGAFAFATAGSRPGLASALFAGAALLAFASESLSTLFAGPLFVLAAIFRLAARRGAASVEALEVARTASRNTEPVRSPLAATDPGRRRTALTLGAIATVVGVLEFLILLFAGAIAAGFGVVEGIALVGMLFIVLAASIVGAIGAALVKERPGLAGGLLLAASFGVFGGLVSAPLFLLAGIIALRTYRQPLTAAGS